ncbi:MAG TPA: sigma-54 dependent transcriptional regulator [Candidatus Sulfotelmatobacter sp.]|nr:sigma-54 dependent transcriptional regulator [Candidatus Sulfotelmatobacter sp.]
MAKEEILLVDDDTTVLEALAAILRDAGYQVGTARSAEEGLRRVQRAVPDLAMVDIWLPGMDGLQLLETLRRTVPQLPVIVISGHGTIETAVRATKLGAYDFLEKPPDMERTLLAVRHALEHRRLEEENRQLRQRLEPEQELVGESPAIRRLREQIAAAAPTHGRVLIRGENGTGKELIARAIHRQSLRRDRPFVAVNCAAIPEELIESELFGHEKGAYTGATAQRRGKFEQADGGTIFLDEVGDMSQKTQAKVLRVLQEQTFERVGGNDTLTADVRVIAASNKDLEAAMQAGTFREDLFYRLNVIPFEVPPLRERKEDIPVLARHFLAGYCVEYGKREKTLGAAAMDRLVQHPWPGNVRELRNLMERMVIMVPANRIEPRDLEPSLAPRPGEGPGADAAAQALPGLEAVTLKDGRARFERAFLLRHLEASGWNITRTAERLGIERSNLHRKLRAYGIEPPGSRSA